MQLIEEEKLSLETKLSEFYPNLPNADKITIQQLLQHETGLFNITNAADFNNWMIQQRSKEELLSKIIENGVTFSPGEKAGYSNTNYIILTFILEDIEKKEYFKILEKRILKPLKLKNTYIGKQTYPQDFSSQSYEKKQGRWEKLQGIHLSIPLGAGGIISTPDDLNNFINGLFDGKLVKETTLEKMKKTNIKYGLGINPVPLVEGVEIYGHSGSMDGFRSFLLYLPEQDISIAITLNAVDYSLKDLV